MPSKAIPLVTISFARRRLPQTRLADNVEQTASGSSRTNLTQEDHPPPNDTASQSSEVATVSPSNEDITQAVLLLSRTLVSTPKRTPRPSSAFMYMVIYGWTQTQQTALRFYHILSKPSSFLRSIPGHNDHALVQQRRKQRKSIQQLSDEEDWLENDVLNGATEMVSVCMMNTRSVATMEESLPEDPEEPDIHGLSSDDDSTGPRKPSRRIDQYHNPFGPGVSSDDEQEDDEEWFGHEEEQTEKRSTKTNSVRLTSRKRSQSYGRRMPNFTAPSPGPAMDPRQFESGENWNPGSSSSSIPSSLPTGPNFGQPLTRLSRSRIPSISPSNNATRSIRQDPQEVSPPQEVVKELKAHVIESNSELHSRQPRSSQIELPWSDKSSLGESCFPIHFTGSVNV